ncbi:transcriptional attenuator, LytR family [Virgibacillus subterraneus]|uniref:Polyisoprenyl-teichoic acid--peptidoglycan teichoic acid transferase TagU n=1 Tax=Virgibacillus subterraneus TaxID=621109 RepID=A0A1H9BP47_9BACI|nr:LCP family protein [Virgibacillus subterraneus]SEP90168.1 transcriptional attenuator, LytR family [Virgibacillus subterraneus]
MDSRIEKRNEKKKRKWPYWVGGVIVALLLIVGTYLFYIYDKVGDTVDVMHEPLARDENPDRQKELNSLFNKNNSINILLLGVDERENDKGRSDTMILMSLNPQINSMKMLSIPRDTYVDIPNRGMDKINHAYAFGGVGLSLQTVEKNFDVPIHFYVKVNMEGFKQGIDALGGVTITNDRAFSQGGVDFPAGEINLNGEEALKYIRMRKGDPRGDIGRNERQRSVIKAAIGEAASFSSITKITDILGILGGNVKTDLNMDQMQTLFSDYRQTRNNIDTMEISGSGQMIENIWYYIVPDEEMNRVQTEIQEHMKAK